ncbi:HD-GYP domain-containing protein [Alkalihalobacillus macyae]|uniref:HD-GYP domain-containing protein n=1 Tax=Guptibacillus hwajinpoensis TaxID=208199 RepID=UPI00273ADF43|nr:HD-GYP domain-containing protein [Alkalihalobacillus macyae]MDP4553042.1 HD-GYP domain-containing protein [Alkalihalobacillus macyae]
MKGFFVGRKNTSLESVEQESASLSLLAKGSGLEFMKHTINKDTAFYIYPGSSPETLEFFYVLEGEIKCENLDLILESGDYFSVKNIADLIFFEAIKTTRLLWVVNEPTFGLISENVYKLIEIVKSVGEKDLYTKEHSDRVQSLSIKIGKKLNLSADDIDNLIVASILHDVGKINVPEEILNKPGSLSDEEYDLMKKHPADGAEMVKDTYYADISTIIHQHHERVNGSGYPDGLKGDQITIGAKIIGVSDSYDAMTDDRSYRKAYTPEYAMDEIKRLSGVLYEPEVVHALEQVLLEDGVLE